MDLEVDLASHVEALVLPPHPPPEPTVARAIEDEASASPTPTAASFLATLYGPLTYPGYAPAADGSHGQSGRLHAVVGAHLDRRG